MTSRNPLSSLQVPANPSNADLLKVIVDGFNNIENRFNNVENRLRNLESIENPMSDDRVYNMPVIGGENHQLTDPTKKNATYTWLEYTPGNICLVGSAHCATTLALPTANALFLELPSEITSLGIESIYLIEPYASDFVNPLPVQKDLIVIKVKAPPPAGKPLPKFSQVTPDKVKQQQNSCVIGRALESVVSSRAGILISESNCYSGGKLQFLVDIGEPGDSGTLLHVKDENGNLHARAIFCGIMPGLNPQYSRRGLGTILPDPKCLTCLPVIAHSRMQPGQQVQVRCFNNNNKSSPGPPLNDITCDIIPKPQLGENAIELKDPRGKVKQGLLVKSNKPINYIGEMDQFRMSAQV